MARSRSPPAPAPRGGAGDLLAGNVAVSLSPLGCPLATLTHPRGGSCQVLLNEARVVSWKTADGVERLAASEGAAAGAGGGSGALGGLGPVGVPCASWDIEALAGAQREDSLSISVFGESSEGGVAMAARTTFSLSPGQLSVELEVANATEPLEEFADAPEGAAAAQLDVACALRGHCSGQAAEASPPPESAGGAAEVLRSMGLILHVEGFPGAVPIEPPLGLREHTQCWCSAFEAATQGPLSLLPGQALTGSVALALAAADGAP